MQATDTHPLDTPGRISERGRRRVGGPFIAGLVVLAILALGLAAVVRGFVPPAAAARTAVSPPPVAQAPGATALQDELMSAAQHVGPAVVSVRTESGLGSGVIYDASGLVLTNAHVVDGSRTINVGLADGRHFSGQVLGADQGFDLAVVKISADNLPAAPLGASSSLLWR